MIVNLILDKSNEWQAQIEVNFANFSMPVFRLQSDVVGVYRPIKCPERRMSNKMQNVAIEFVNFELICWAETQELYCLYLIPIYLAQEIGEAQEWTHFICKTL